MRSIANSRPLQPAYAAKALPFGSRLNEFSSDPKGHAHVYYFSAASCFSSGGDGCAIFGQLRSKLQFTSFSGSWHF